jgi:hypothetical protein
LLLHARAPLGRFALALDFLVGEQALAALGFLLGVGCPA